MSLPSRQPQGPGCSSDTCPPSPADLACQGRCARAQIPSGQASPQRTPGPPKVRCSTMMPIRTGRGTGSETKCSSQAAARATGVGSPTWPPCLKTHLIGAGLYPPHRTVHAPVQRTGTRRPSGQLTASGFGPMRQSFIGPQWVHPSPLRSQVRGGWGSAPWISPRLKLEQGSSSEPHPT